MRIAIADKKEGLAAVLPTLRRGPARSVGLGGARHDFDPQTSDADFAVEFDPDSGLMALDQFFDLAEAPSMTLGRPVGLVEAGAIDNRHFRAAVSQSCERAHAP